MCVYIILVTAEVKNEQNQDLQRVKREEDDDYYRRLHRIQSQFGRTSFASSFLKYFIRNRHQKRERRDINELLHEPVSLVPIISTGNQKRERRQVKDYNYYRNYPTNNVKARTYQTIPSSYYNYSPVDRSSYIPNYQSNYRPPINYRSPVNYYTDLTNNYQPQRRQLTNENFEHKDLQRAASENRPVFRKPFRPTPAFFK